MGSSGVQDDGMEEITRSDGFWSSHKLDMILSPQPNCIGTAEVVFTEVAMLLHGSSRGIATQLLEVATVFPLIKALFIINALASWCIAPKI